MEKLKIRKSPTADTRTCDCKKVDKATLLKSSIRHINDVRRGLEYFKDRLVDAGYDHDFDKIENIDQFHADFVTNFNNHYWWDRHRIVSRHHLNAEDGVPSNVNLIDVLEHIVDCVMAGMARSGSVYELKLPDELLQKAFQNTVEMLKSVVVVEEESD